MPILRVEQIVIYHVLTKSTGEQTFTQRTETEEELQKIVSEWVMYQAKTGEVVTLWKTFDTRPVE